MNTIEHKQSPGYTQTGEYMSSNFFSNTRYFAITLLMAVLLLYAPLTPAKNSPDTEEHWDDWQALSSGYVGRRKVPANANQSATNRRLSNVEERLENVRRLAIRNLQEQLQNSNGGAGSGNDFQRRRSTYKGNQSDYSDERSGYEAFNTNNGKPGADKSSDHFVQQLKRLEQLIRKRQKERRKKDKPRDDELAVWLRTGTEGLYAASIADLAAAIEKDANSVRNVARRGRLSVTGGGQPVAWYFDESTDSILFVGEEYETFYTDENAYRVSFGNRDEIKLMSESNGVPTGNTGFEAPYTDTLKFEEEPAFFFATWSVASEPDADYWWWDYLYGGFKDVIEVNLQVPNPAPSGYAQLRATLRGWTDLEAGDEHQVYAELNGVSIGPVVTWDGFDQIVLTADFDQSLLNPSGNNVLHFRNSYQAGTHPGQWLDEVELDYSRRPVAGSGILRLHDVAPGTQTVGGFSSQEILVIEAPAGDAVLRTDTRVDADGAGGYSVTFETNGNEDYLVVERGAIDTPLAELDEPSSLSDRSNAADYLIIAPRSLAGTAEALASHRRNRFGYVEIAWLNEIYDEFSHGREDPVAVTRFMETALRDWRLPPSYVVVIGKGSLDHKDRMGYSDSFVPIVMIDTPWSLAASDHRLLAGDQDADFAIGRLPITNDEDGLAYVDKLIAYESSTPGSELYQAVLAADNPDDGGEFHTNSDLLADRLTDSLGFDGVTKFYHPQNPVRQNMILSATWDRGYVNYDGHGSATQVGNGNENFIKASDASNLQNTTYPVFTALTCAAGDYTLPGSRSLAGSLVINPAGGAIASLAPTGLSLDADAQLLNNAFVDRLFGSNLTVGEAIKQAKLETNGVQIQTMPRMYGIVGDPGVYAR